MLKLRKNLQKFALSCFILSCGSATIAQTINSAPPNAISNIKIATTKPGTLLSIQAQEPSSLLSHAAQRYLITYRSRGVNNEPIVTSGYIVLPKGQSPKGGWPIIAWAHGTTGVADTCAPSGNYPNGPVNSYQNVAEKALNAWLAKGYAVVATDYQGLGTPGGHPYMNAVSQLHTVVDSVRALHSFKPKSFSKTWYVMGHSQGGAAALTVAAYGQKDAPEYNLAGAIALAPGGYKYEGIAEYVEENPKPAVNVVAFFPIVLLGAEAADPTLSPDHLVSKEMQVILNSGRSRCLSELQTDLKKPPESIFKPNANLAPLIAYLKKQSIEYMTPTVPLMIVQGTQDQLVDYHGTYAYYQQQCKAGKSINYHPLPNGDHRDSLRQSEFLIGDFINAVEQKRKISTCGQTQ